MIACGSLTLAAAQLSTFKAQLTASLLANSVIAADNPVDVSCQL